MEPSSIICGSAFGLAAGAACFAATPPGTGADFTCGEALGPFLAGTPVVEGGAAWVFLAGAGAVGRLATLQPAVVQEEEVVVLLEAAGVWAACRLLFTTASTATARATTMRAFHRLFMGMIPFR